jgi:hypothetical protein
VAPAKDRSWLKSLAETTMIRITVAMITALEMASRSIAQDKRTKSAATMSEPTTPVSALSEGVATPIRIRPMTEVTTSRKAKTTWPRRSGAS